MKKGYKKQILNYNIEKIILIVRADLNMFFFTKILIQANQNAALKINLVNDVKNNLKDLKQHLDKNES